MCFFLFILFHDAIALLILNVAIRNVLQYERQGMKDPQNHFSKITFKSHSQEWRIFQKSHQPTRCNTHIVENNYD